MAGHNVCTFRSKAHEIKNFLEAIQFSQLITHLQTSTKLPHVVAAGGKHLKYGHHDRFVGSYQLCGNLSRNTHGSCQITKVIQIRN